MAETIALIPARGGSKRIPRKNIKPFKGRPMIAYAIAAARNSGCFDRIIVSTEDAEIAAVAIAEGAEVPFTRPAALADDYATTQAVLEHAVDWCDAAGMALDLLCCIYPAAALVDPRDIAEGLTLLDHEQGDYTITVTPFPSVIQRALKIAADNRVDLINPAFCDTRTQDLEPAYFDSGQFYWCRADAIRQRRPMYGDRAVPQLIPAWRVQDIDTPEDWARAEMIYEMIERQAAAKATG